jgi:GxxExxY protein
MTPMTPMTPNHSFDERTYAIIGAAQEVHRVLGPGFLERVYQAALACELRRRGISFEREVDLPISYKGELLDCSYRVDFLCHQEVIVETKAQSATGGPEEGQVLNYLKASALDVALLLNFGTERLEVRRFSMSWLREATTSSATSAPSADGRASSVN